MSTQDGRFLELRDRETPRMFAPSLRQAVADEREVLGLDAAVEQLDLSQLEAQYSEVGHPAYPPKAMVKVVIYGYCLELRSSRMLERACKRDDAFRFLAHGLRPTRSRAPVHSMRRSVIPLVGALGLFSGRGPYQQGATLESAGASGRPSMAGGRRPS